MPAIAVANARDLGRDLLSGTYFDTVPAGEAFSRAIGGTPILDFHSNTVRIDDLDLDMLREWREQGPARGTGYSVEVVEGMYPEEILDGIARLYVVLERDMPHPDTWEPRDYDADFVREWVGNFLKGVHLLTAIAFHDESGEPVGMSQLGRRHTDDTTWLVTTTMVDPEHRGHALGKWVKAAASLAALERWPRGVWMETGNAFTNEPMLGINHAMGFRHEFTMSEAEVDVENAEAYLTG
jgi:GNAT superfamily N-acetyltransferase